ncbi:MAG: hypothetical protein ABIH99_02220 [Candidatus Micrarchaeota archaeon]
MLVLKETKRSELFSKIREKSASSETKISAKVKLSTPVLIALLTHTKMDELVCTRAIFNTVPRKAREALEKVGVKVKLVREKRGRPRVLGERKIGAISAMVGREKNAREISQKLGIPLRTVYYYLRKAEREKQ